MKKIAYKFAAAMIMLVAVALAALMILAGTIMQISNQSQSFMDHEVAEIDTIHVINENYLQIYTAMYAHVNTKLASIMDKKADQIRATRTEMWQKMKEYEAQIDSEEVQAVFDVVESKMNDYDAAIEEILAASRSGDKETANLLITNKLYMVNDSIVTNMARLMSASEINLASGEVALEEAAARAQTGVKAAAAVLIVMVVAVTFISNRIIVMPIKKMAVEIGEMIADIQQGRGDLTRRVAVGTKDETAVLAEGVNQFLSILQEMIDGVIMCGREIDEQQQKVSGIAENTNRSAEETSSMMHGLAAAMQEISATAACVNDTTKEAEESAGRIVDKAVEGTAYAVEIKNRAEELRRRAQENRRSAEGAIRQLDEALKVSIQNSRQIENINGLTDTILSVASKTNMLALNASIEAARAGEAGRGFVVVANEIRVLADNARETANSIQNISQGAVDAVMQLAENARQMVQFVDEHVMPDYEVLEKTGDKYLEDSITVDQIMSGIRTDMEAFGSLMETVSGSNDAIADNVHESARNITDVVGNTTSLTDSMQDILGALEQVSAAIGQLLEQTETFGRNTGC